MKYYIKTFGCQMNHSDSERIAGFLELQPHSSPLLSKERVFTPAKNINEADLVIFNTCGVRQMAEDRVYGQIHNIHITYNTKHKTHKKIIIVTGCLANRKDVQRRLKNKVDLFCEIKDFPEKLKTLLIRHPEQGDSRVEGSASGYLKFNNNSKNLYQHRADSSTPLRFARNDDFYLDIKPKYSNPHTAYIPIMTGCNNFCSYCIVPYARGSEVSRPAEEITSEVKQLVKKGYKEIILLGQNVNSYTHKSRCQNPNAKQNPKSKVKIYNFSKLLKSINEIPGNFWIWFVSNHPKDISDELIKTATGCKKVCECVHLPIQAGDDEVLRRMNRRYTAKDYLNLISKIKKAFRKNKSDKLFGITSDIIVGFPGETKKQFLKSAKVMETVGYDMVFFGQFSPRPGTAACKTKDNVSKKEKTRREQYLNEILKRTSFENNKKYVGKTIEVLVDKEKNNFYFGHTRTMKNVKIKLTPTLSLSRRGSKNKNLVGKIVKAKITKANTWNLEAETIK